MRVLVVLGLALIAPARLYCQTDAPLDSAGVASAIAHHLITRSASDPWSGVIDTTGSRWGALVRLALWQQAPSSLPALGDSATYYASHFRVTSVSKADDDLLVAVGWRLCYHPDVPNGFSYASTREYWRFQASPAGWQYVKPASNHGIDDQVMTGDGDCPPWKRGGAR